MNIEELMELVTPEGLEFLEVKTPKGAVKFYCKPMDLKTYNMFLMTKDLAATAPYVILKCIVNVDRTPFFKDVKEINNLPTWLQNDLFNYVMAFTTKLPEDVEIEKSLKPTGSKDSDTD